MTSAVSVLSAVATLVACFGWGRLVARGVGIRVDGGLALSWGLAALLFVGGCATALGVATLPLLAGLVGVGLLAAAVPWPLRQKLSLDRGAAALLLGMVLIIGLRLFSAANVGANEPCDDFLAYQPLIQQLQQAGDIEAPFSLRRMAAYGGQTLLQALVSLNGDYHAVTMADAGLGPVLLLGLGWSFLARAGRPNRWALALALMFGLGAILRTNSGSQLTSLVCFLALVRTLMLLRDHRSLRLCMVAGLLAAAASSLRHLNLPFPLLLLLAFLPGHFRQFGWRGVLRDGVVVGVSWLVFLAPWMAALYASNATPIYPLIKGYHNPAFNFAMPTEGWRQIVETLGGVMLQSQIPAMLAVVPAALLLARDRTVRNVQWAALAGAAIIVASFPAAAPLHMARYIQPTLATACFLALMHLVGDGVLSSRVVRGAIAACVVLGLGHVAVVDVDLLWTEANHTRPLHYSRELIEERLAAYAEGQRQVPAGAPIFVYVSAPFGFDQGRNRILNADEPGPVSPPPGLPFFKGGEAVAAYLQSLGIRHVAFEDYDTAATWCISPAGIDTIVEPLWQPWKPYLFDLMANMRELGRTRRVLYASHGVWVVDLGEPVAQTRAGAALHIP